MSHTTIPTHIFIIPYRNREKELQILVDTLPNILYRDGITNYQFFVIRQTDKKLFNRGMMLNIGFLEVKKRYPHNWKTIQLICHDVDIYPTKPNIINYNTIKGKVNHPYGVLRPHLNGTVGGICIITGEDYNLSGGHPNFFGWGGEDIGMSRRCQAKGIIIDESKFIDRRTSPFIVDPESHPTPKELKFSQICDKRNLSKVFKENPAQPIDTFNNINYQIISETNILTNILMINVTGHTIF